MIKFEFPDFSLLGLKFVVFDLRFGFLVEHCIYIYIATWIGLESENLVKVQSNYKNNLGFVLM